jgi:hypothetical protein
MTLIMPTKSHQRTSANKQRGVAADDSPMALGWRYLKPMCRQQHRRQGGRGFHPLYLAVNSLPQTDPTKPRDFSDIKIIN